MQSNGPSHPSNGAINGGISHTSHMPMNDGQTDNPTQNSRPSNPTSRPNRELKVEDALFYLDQVKVEFGDKPEIYNEFLDIMKNFKAQAIDTIDVIGRVSHLFRGYNNLILGFNTFLPSGFKINLSDIEEMNRVHASNMAANEEQSLGQKQTQFQPSPSGIAQPTRGLPNNPSVMIHRGVGHIMGQPQQMQQSYPQHMVPRVNSNIESVTRTMNDIHPIAVYPSIDVRNQDEPNGSIVVPRRVGEGVMGNMPLIPGGLVPRLERSSQQTYEGGVTVAASQQSSSNGIAVDTNSSDQQGEFDHAISYVTTIKKRFSAEPQTYKAFLEILHTYQKEQRGIKEVLEQVSSLFADHPDLLRQFVYFLPDPVQDQARERLHRAALETEERHRRADQLSSSAQSLSGGPYCPPPNRTVVPPMISRSGPHKDSNKRRRPDIDGDREYHASEQHPRPREHDFYRPISTTADDNVVITEQSRKAPIPRRGIMSGPPSVKNERNTREPRTEKIAHSPNVPPPKKSSALLPVSFSSKSRTTTNTSKDPQRILFETVRETLLEIGGKEAWTEFLKCIEMCSANAFSQAEMLELVEDLFGTNIELFAEFRRVVEQGGMNGLKKIGGIKEDKPTVSADLWSCTPLAEIDFSQCRNCTPSYRALPKDFPRLLCSERTSMDEAMLNDTWVSVPVGSEDCTNDKSSRRNNHADILFRCEDERYEMDMLIDSTNSTIKVLEPLKEEISKLSIESSNFSMHFQYKLDYRSLSVIHLKTISRIYGQNGEQILELLRKNPVCTIPVVLDRLKNKEEEWRKARAALDCHWRHAMQRSFSKSLDRRSMIFKVADRRAFSSRALLSEIRHKIMEREEINGSIPCIDEISPNSPILKGPNICLRYPDMEVQRDIYHVLLRAVETGAFAPGERDRMRRICIDILPAIFGLQMKWLFEGMPMQRSSESQSGIPIPKSTAVFTAYGEGTVVDHLPNENYVVELSFGTVEIPNDFMFRVLYEGKGKKSLQSKGERNEDTEITVRPPNFATIIAQELYFFLKYHWSVADRFAAAKLFCRASAQRKLKEVPHPLKQLVCSDDEDDASHFATSVDSNAQIPPEGMGSYPGFILMMHATLKASANEKSSSNQSSSTQGGVSSNESMKFEDYVQTVMGNEAYSLFGLDKHVQALARQLKIIADDPLSIFLLQSWHDQCERRSMSEPSGEDLLPRGSLYEYIMQLKEKKKLRPSDEIFNVSVVERPTVEPALSESINAAISAAQSANVDLSDESWKSGKCVEVEYIGMVDSSGKNLKKLSSSDSSSCVSSSSATMEDNQRHMSSDDAANSEGEEEEEEEDDDEMDEDGEAEETAVERPDSQHTQDRSSVSAPSNISHASEEADSTGGAVEVLEPSVVDNIHEESRSGREVRESSSFNGSDQE